jgi:hypothetical protein
VASDDDGDEDVDAGAFDPMERSGGSGAGGSDVSSGAGGGLEHTSSEASGGNGSIRASGEGGEGGDGGTAGSEAGGGHSGSGSGSGGGSVGNEGGGEGDNGDGGSGGGYDDDDAEVPALLVTGDDLAAAMIEQELEHVRQLSTLVHALEAVLFDGSGADLHFTPVEEGALASAPEAAAAVTAAATPRAGDRGAPPLLNIEISIGGGRQARIAVHRNADTMELATRFVEHHELPQSAVVRLAQFLQQHLEAQLIREAKRLSPARVNRESATKFSL